MTTPTKSEEKNNDKPVSFLKKFLNEEQDPEVVKVVHEKVSEILTKGEEILYIAVQNKPVVNLSPDCVVLTNRRFIIYKPKLFGRVDFDDYIWRDLKDAKLKEGVMGAVLNMQTIHNKNFTIEYLPKKQARRIYSIAQEMEEFVREERRTREIEEKRAASGGFTFQNPTPIQPQQTSNSAEDPIQTLKRLKTMLDSELITEEEYNTKKTEILSRM